MAGVAAAVGGDRDRRRAGSPPSRSARSTARPPSTAQATERLPDGLVAPSPDHAQPAPTRAAVAAAVQRVLRGASARGRGGWRWSCRTAPPRSRWSGSRRCRPSAEDLDAAGALAGEEGGAVPARAGAGVVDAAASPTPSGAPSSSSPSRGSDIVAEYERRCAAAGRAAGARRSRDLQHRQRCCSPATRGRRRPAAATGCWCTSRPIRARMAIVRGGDAAAVPQSAGRRRGQPRRPRCTRRRCTTRIA